MELYIPDAHAVQQFYINNKDQAYWAKVWPASVGLCIFLQQNIGIIKNKNVLELAAGLGLPGLSIATNAGRVTITDKEPLAKTFVQQSAKYLQLKNVTARTLSWQQSISEPLPDVVLLSDVNYEPEVFEELWQVIQYFLNNNITVIISTPQRLVAKDFIARLLPFVAQQWNDNIELDNRETSVSVFVLTKDL